MGKDLLFEIGCEEIPARFLGPSLRDLESNAAAFLERARIDHGEVRSYGTPRRLVLTISELSETQRAGEEKRLGPHLSQAFDDKGKPTKAALGFARSCGAEVEELGRETTPKGERLVFVRGIEGKPAGEVLEELLPDLARSLVFPKSMRWGEGDMSFVRPVHWVLALLGNEVVVFSLDGIKSGAMSRGHRFTHPEPFPVTGVADYFESLERKNVVADPRFRRELIEREVEKTGRDLGGELYPDPELMEEVTDLVEYPLVISGTFDEKFLTLPPEVLIAAMRTHQRYFAVTKPGAGRELLPVFITVANTPAPDMTMVARGNERVLGARLADAEFYWEEDKKTGLESMRQGTADMVFYKTLGSYLDKTGRVEELCRHISSKLFPGDDGVASAATTAARYCKADLLSQMVGEFPELQGIMGGEYARSGGLGDEVSAAVRDHYLPRSADDIARGAYPRTGASEVLSIADKIDSLVACWAAGLSPTGAGDPFALRRQAQAVTNLILARGHRLDFPELVDKAAVLACPLVDADPGRVAAEVIEFVLGRVRGQAIESGTDYDVVDACLSAWNGDLVDTSRKVEAVARMKTRDDFDDLMVAFRRLMNIVEGKPGPVDTNLFVDEAEAVLYGEYTRVDHNIRPLLAAGSYDEALSEMATLKPSVDRFFDEVLVNTDDQGLRDNRHALCATVTALFREIADFSKIVIAGDRANR